MDGLVMKQSQRKEVVGLELGNSHVRVFFANKTIVMYNSLLLEKGNVYINKKPTNLCLADIPLLLSVKYEDKAFEAMRRYYNYGFKKGYNRNIQIQLYHESPIQDFHAQLAMILIIKGIFNTNAHLKYLLTQKEVKLVVTVFEGEINCFRLALSRCIKAAQVRHFSLVSTSHCIAVSYEKDRKKREDSQVVAVADFGDRGLAVTVYRVSNAEVGIVEVLRSQANQLGGKHLTNLLTDYIAEKLVRQKGMDVTKTPKIMHRLKLLCQEAKHTLSGNEMAFVRLDGLPDIMVYGSEVSSGQFQKCIGSAIKQNITLIKEATNLKDYQASKLILTGNSCKIPYFRSVLSQQCKNIKIMDCHQDWIRCGLLEIKTSAVHILDITPFQLKIQGDEKYSLLAITKGESIPLRKKIPMKFPSGQLTYSMRFYQNNLLVASCLIPERPSQTKYNLYIEVDHNKMLNIYATNSRGLIKMNCNMMEIPKEEYQKYEELLSQLDFHNEND